MNNEDGSNDVLNPKYKAISSSTIRFVLSQSTIITKSKLSKVIKGATNSENTSSIKFDDIFNEMNRILDHIYGYKLVGVNSRQNKDSDTHNEPNSSNRSDKDSKSTNFILLNNLEIPEHYKSFIMKQTESLFKTRIVNNSYVGNHPSIISEPTIENKVLTDRILVLNGIICIIICIVLFSKNNILHEEMTAHLLTFGIPINGNKIPILDISLEELLNNLVKFQYIIKIEETSLNNEDIVIFYRIGKRAQLEFDKQSIINLSQNLLGVDSIHSEYLNESIDMSIGDSYSL